MRVAGGGPAASDCLLEWSLAESAVAVGKDGAPAAAQTCVDGDPACDFDPQAGNCRFHLWACLGRAEPRLGCPAQSVARADVLGLKTTGGWANVARGVVRDALRRIAYPAGPGEVCTDRIDVDAPAGRSRLLLQTSAASATGTDKDGLKLSCVSHSPRAARR